MKKADIRFQELDLETLEHASGGFDLSQIQNVLGTVQRFSTLFSTASSTANSFLSLFSSFSSFLK